MILDTGGNIKRALIIGLVWPEPNSTAAGGRMLQLIQLFIKNKYHLTFASTAAETEFTYDLNLIGVDKTTIQLNHPSFDNFIKELNPEFVLFDRFMVEEQFGWRVAKHLPNALRILDTEDLHSLRFARHEALKDNKVFTLDQWLQNAVTKREIASVFRCDCSLIISSYEMELLQMALKIDQSLLVYLPFLLDNVNENEIKEWLSFENREGFVCIGNGKHAPNIDGMIWLKNDIWPVIRQHLPTVNVHIYGAYLPERIKHLHNPKEGFYVMGRVAEVKEVMGKAKINLAPLRFGAGLKGKLIEAMQTGTPSTTTTIGAEGMHQNLSWNGKISDDPVEFANATAELYQDKTKWNKAQQNGIDIINQLFDKKVLGNNLISTIEILKNNLQEHRAQNFVGSMLMHHTMASTKYLARWIEAKNKP